MNIKEKYDRRSILKFFGFGAAAAGLTVASNPSVAKAVNSLTPTAPVSNNVSTAALSSTAVAEKEIVTVTETVLVDKNHFKTWVDDIVELFGKGQCRSYVFTAYSGYVIVKGYANRQMNRIRIDLDDVPDWFKPLLTEMIHEGMPSNTTKNTYSYRGRGDKPIDERTYIRLFNACLNHRVCDIASLKEFVHNEACRKAAMAAVEAKRIEEAKKVFTNIPGPVKVNVVGNWVS